MSGQHDLLTVSMFGDLWISINNLPIPRIPAKAQELFALLVLWNDQPISRQRLASTLWPGSKQPNARGLLRSCLMELRKALGPAAVRLPTEDRTTLHLNLEGAYVDVFEFDRAASQNTLEAARTARALYRHELLQGWQAAWVQPERDRRAVAYTRLFQPISTGATTDLPATHVAPGRIAPSMPGGRHRSALAEIRTLLASNREELLASCSRLDRLEEQIECLSADVLAQDDTSRAEGLYALGVSKHLEGDLEGARACQEQVVETSQQLDDAAAQLIQAKALDQLGRLELSTNKEGARRYHLRAYEIRNKQHHDLLRDMVSSLLALGDTAATLPEALGYYERALQMAQSNRDDGGTAWAHFSLAIAPVFRNACEMSSLPVVLSHFDEALSGFMGVHDPTGLFAVLEGVARVCHRVGNQVGAARMVEIEALLREEYAAPQTVVDTEEANSAFQAVRRERTATAVVSQDSAWLDQAAVVEEVKQLIRDLPEIAHDKIL
jgi:tetratricopeptide (TPR) repeat protein